MMDKHEETQLLKRAKPLWVVVLLVVAIPPTLFAIRPSQARIVCQVIIALSVIVGGLATFGSGHFERKNTEETKKENDREKAEAKKEADREKKTDRKRFADIFAHTEQELKAANAKLDLLVDARAEAIKLPILPPKGAEAGLSDVALSAVGMTRKEFDNLAQQLKKGTDAFLKGKIEFVSKHYREATALFDEAAAKSIDQNPSDPALKTLQDRRAGTALAFSGRAYRALGDWDEAIRRFQDSLKFIDPVAQELTRAEVQGMLASSLLNRAQRTEGDGLTPAASVAARIASAYQAIEVGKEALAGFSPSTRDWAWVKNILGTAYFQLAEATGGTERDKNLQKSLAEYKQSLGALTKEAAPDLWSMVKANYGTALQLLAESKAPDEARSLLISSIAEITEANTGLSFAKFPVEWGQNQQKLATAYRDLADLGDDPNKNRASAIDCYKAALSVMTFDSDPRRWATAQQDLSIILNKHAAANPEYSHVLLIDALTANDSAATVFTRARDPERWAHNCNYSADLKRTLATFAEGASQRKLMDDARLANEDAMKVFSKQDYPLQWAAAKLMLATGLIVEGKTGRSSDKLLAALVVLKDAASVVTEDAAPSEYCQIHCWKGSALYELARYSRVDAKFFLRDAIEAYQDGLSCFNRKKFRNAGTYPEMLAFGLKQAQEALDGLVQ